MATVSSHILDSVIGSHAGGIPLELYRLNRDGTKEKVFEVISTADGRIFETVDLSLAESTEYELVFHSAKYFGSQPHMKNVQSKQVLNAVVVRLTLDDNDAKYHIPMMLSPHSYSVWWSGQ